MSSVIKILKTEAKSPINGHKKVDELDLQTWEIEESDSQDARKSNSFAETNLKQEQLESALDDLKKSLFLAEKDQSKQLLYETHQRLANLYQQKGDFEKAFFHHQKFHSIEKEIIDEKAEQRCKELQTKQKEVKQFRQEMELKNKEIQILSLRLSQKDQLLKVMHGEIKQIKIDISATVSDKLDSLKERIDEHQSYAQDWDTFETEFNRTHQDFTNQLSKKYPDLTAKQLKICALTRINMSSVEIGDILHLSPRSIDSQRYRIRKKLALHRDQNLITFLMSI